MLNSWSNLLCLLFLIGMFINILLLVGIFIRPSLRTSLNIFLSSLLILNIIKLGFEIVSR